MVQIATGPESRLLAMLIDGENAQPSLIENVLTEAAKHGIITTRRIYGDWTTPQMGGWKESLNSLAVQPVQQFRYTVGKNSTDSALIIEAMDILHSGTVGGFCIVSSDSDYTRLATRIREQGLFVMGVGRSNTPKPFVNACEVFVYTENLTPNKTNAIPSSKGMPPVWTNTVTQAIDMVGADDGWALLANVGSGLLKLDPAFDSRSYGHKQLSLLIKSAPEVFELRERKSKNGPSIFDVRVKS